MTSQLLHGDCHQLLTTLPPDSVDLVLTDPPYGIMKCNGETDWNAEKLRWDERLDQTTIWAELNRVVRPKGMILLFSKEPLTSQLIQSTHTNLPFSYRLIWVKNHFGHPLSCRRMPVNFLKTSGSFTNSLIAINVTGGGIMSQNCLHLSANHRKRLLPNTVGNLRIFYNTKICNFRFAPKRPGSN